MGEMEDGGLDERVMGFGEHSRRCCQSGRGLWILGGWMRTIEIVYATKSYRDNV